MKNYSKLSEIDLSNEGLVLKDYVKHMTLRHARTKFRLRSHTLDVKMNRKSDPMYAKNLWKCDFCFSLDTQSHIVWCPAFATLREGKNLQDDMDLINYVNEVMKIREDFKS